MANASAKKAAAAQKNATFRFLPILLALNVIHLGLVFYRDKVSIYRIFMTLIQWIVTYVSYQGIIHDIASKTTATSSSSSVTTTSSSSHRYKLAGGAWLDLLFLVLLSQFGALVIHEGFMDSILFVVPMIYGLLYRYYWDSSNKSTTPDVLNPRDEDEMKMLEERRRKRAERRRQKRF